jgi:tRNA threonylcarbamoyladenosine biosynthesis protein TsaB
MHLLVTDTSGRQGSVALACSGEPDKLEVIEVVPLIGGTFSAQLVPQIAGLLQKHKRAKSDIDAFVVVSGPGSFTGLRVGLAAIKALAEILKKPIAAVSLLEVLAHASRLQGKVAAVLDAGRGDVYFGAYETAGESCRILREERLSKAGFLAVAKQSSVVTPDGALAAAARSAGLSVTAIDPPTPEAIARLGLRKLQAGEIVSPEQLEANYMLGSDADLFVKTSS